MIKSGYTAEDLAKLGPDALTRKKLLAEALMADATKQRKIEHPLQGMAQMAEALMGGLRLRKLDAAEKFGKESADKDWGALSKIMGGGSSSGSSMPASGASAEISATSPSGGTPQSYRDAIASIESAGSGDYNAIGPRHKTLGRALGRYQVMEGNIPQWSREALGREISADEFMADPKLQDAIFDHRFGQYVNKYGPEGAAQAWFGGEGGVGKLDRKDSLGTSIGAYSDKFRNALGGREVASLSPQDGLGAEVAQFEKTPEYAAQFPGANQGQLANALMGGQSGQEAIAGQMPRQTQVAQALMGDGGSQRSGVDPALIQALSNPYLDPQRRAVAQTLLDQQIQQNDPLRQLQLQKGQLELEQMRNPQLSASDRLAREKFAWEQQNAGQTNDIKEYEYAKGQGYTGSFADFQQAMKKAGAASTNVNVGSNSSKFAEKSDEAAAKRFDEIVAAGQGAPQTMADMQQLLDLGAQIGTGNGAKVKAMLGPYAQALGIDIENLPEIQAYEAITARLAPQMRAVGSGSSSDKDVALFFQSLPNIRNLPGGNELIGNTMKAVAQNKMNAAEIASKAQRGEISWQDADKQIANLPNPYELFKKFQSETQKPKKSDDGNPMAGSVVDGYRFKGGDPADPANWEQEM